MYYFTADEHYWHRNILWMENRPWDNISEMNKGLISNNNKIVKPEDTVFHLGDFCLSSKKRSLEILEALTGKHILIKANHDKWLKVGSNDTVFRTDEKLVSSYKYASAILEIEIKGQLLVLSHYAMRSWPRSHYGSWNLFGHSHCKLEPIGNQYDIGVDCNDYYPVSFEEIEKIIETKKEEDKQNKLERIG